MADYATAAALKGAGRLNITGNTYDADLAKLVTMASRWIDRETWGITDAFKATATSTRYFGPSAVRRGVLSLGAPLVSVSVLTNGDGNTLASYRLLPRNSSPKWEIALLSTASWAWAQDGEIEVSGVWGYSADVPPQVEEACLVLAGWMFKRWQQALQDRSPNMELGQMVYHAALPATVRELLRPVTPGASL